MKKTLFMCLSCMGLLGFGQDGIWESNPQITALFENAKVAGCFVVLDPSSGKWVGHNQARAGTAFIPASTFKIANTLISLETGVVKSVDEVLPYGGNPQTMQIWAKDMPLREAIAVSNVPLYQGLARRIGLERMQAWVTRLNYGNQTIGPAVDRFWLVGPLKISAFEQVNFIHQLLLSKLPLSKENQAATREILLLEQQGNSQLFGKTGWTTQPDPDIAWLVGWVKNQEKVYPFALNMDLPDPSQRDLRISLAKESLEILGLYP